ncbi:MAG: Spy/CpxP family protein refolding chaperone [Pseudomonadota bacterium]
MIKTFLASVGGLTLLAGAAFSAYAVAGGGGHHRMFNPDRAVERFSKRLDLDDTQQAEVRGIVEQAVPVMRAAREDMMAGRTALIDLDPASADYNAEVAELAETAAQHARAIVTQLGQARLDMSAVLSDEQQAEFDQMLSRAKRWGRHHKRGHDGE